RLIVFWEGRAPLCAPGAPTWSRAVLGVSLSLREISFWLFCRGISDFLTFLTSNFAYYERFFPEAPDPPRICLPRGALFFVAKGRAIEMPHGSIRSTRISDVFVLELPHL